MNEAYENADVCENVKDDSAPKLGSIGIDKRWEYGQYLQMLIEVHKAGHDCHAEINEVLAKLREITFD